MRKGSSERERRRRSQQRGVVLILTLFVILITYALVTQLTLGTQVALQTTRNASNRIRMREACRSAAVQLLDTLAEDGSGLTEAAGAMGAAGDLGGMGGLGGESGFGGGGGGGEGGLGGGGGGEGGEGGEGEEEDNADSWEDGWAQPMRIVMGDIQITSWIQDENSKMNLLSLVAEDPDFREASRERAKRVLDRLREDFDDDLSFTDASRIVDDIVQWLEGYARDDEYPRPPRHSNPEEGDTSLMFTLDELLVLEHVTPAIFYDDLREDEEIAPGLESVFTVWTSVDLAPPEEGTGSELGGEVEGEGAGEGTGSLPGGSGAPGGEEFGEGGDPGGLGSGAEETGAALPQGGMDGAANGDPVLGIKVNLNTVAPAVLRGLMDPGIFSETIIDEILEYRNEIDEEALAEQEGEEYNAELSELETSLYGEQEKDAEPRLYFKSLDDLDKIESLEGLDTATRQEFLDLVDVRSDIFSVYLFARIQPQDWMPEERYEEPPGPVLRMRAVVWRRNTQNGTKFLYLLPWHEVGRTRWRIPDYQDRLEPFMPPTY